MSKISAQIWAFVVLMLALALGVWFVDNQDINTGVNTKEESILPNIFPAEGEENPTGLTFRYPRRWTVQTADTSFSLTTNLDEETPFSLGLFLEQLATDANLEQELLAFIQEQGFGAESALENFEDDVEEVEHGLEAVRYELELEDDTVVPFEIVRLTDDNMVLKVIGTSVENSDIAEVWEAIDNILASINAENVVIPEPLLTYTLPEGWQLVEETDTSFRAVILTDQAGQQGALTWVQVLPKEDALAFLSGIVGDIAPEAAVADAQNASDLLPMLAEQESFESVSEVTPVELFGLSGNQVSLEVANIGLLDVIVLEADESTDVVVINNYTSAEVKETQQAAVEEVLNSVQYNPQDAE